MYLQTGYESNGDPLFVARAQVPSSFPTSYLLPPTQVAGGHWALGKLNPKMGMAHLPYGGKVMLLLLLPPDFS